MRYKLAIMVALLFASIAGVGTWQLLRPPVALLILPGATDIQVRQIVTGEQLIAYHTPGQAYVWRRFLANTLEEHGWEISTGWTPDSKASGLDATASSFTYGLSFGFGTVVDQADLRGAGNEVRIILRHSIEPPRWMAWLRGLWERNSSATEKERV